MPRVDGQPLPRTPAKRPPPLQPRRPSRLQLLWRRKRRLLWPAAGALVLAVLAVFAVSALQSFRAGASVASLGERLGIGRALRVQDVRINGLEKTPERLLRAALGVAPGDRLLGFSLDDARARIESLTWVQSATVERRLPGTIVVTLTERRPIAVWQNNGSFQLIDKAGQVVEKQDPVKDAAAFKTLPLVVGPGAPETAASLLAVLATQPALHDRLSAAVRVGERRWTLHLKSGTDVLLPEGAEGPAMDRLAELQSTQALLDRPLQSIDLRLPDRLVVRPTATPASSSAPSSAPSSAKKPT